MCVCQPARMCVCVRHLGKLQLKHLLANVSTLRFVCVVCVCVCVLKIMVCEHKHCASGKRSPLYTNSLWPFACFTNKSPLSHSHSHCLPLPHAVGVDVCQFRASMSHSLVIVAATAAADAAAGSRMSRKRRRRRRRCCCLAATANVGTVTGVWNCKFANGASHRWVHPGPF